MDQNRKRHTQRDRDIEIYTKRNDRKKNSQNEQKQTINQFKMPFPLRIITFTLDFMKNNCQFYQTTIPKYTHKQHILV